MFGCLFGLGLLGALIGAYYVWLAPHVTGAGLYIGASIAGFATFCCIGALLNARNAWGDRRLIKAAERDTPPIDGRRIAAVGRLEAQGELLTAPFSGAECILCEYEITTHNPQQREGDTSRTEYAGFAMNPCHVQTRHGRVRLLGFPELEDVQARKLTGREVAQRGLAYLRTAQFEDVSGARLAGAFRHLKEVWLDEDGYIRKDMRLRSLKKESLFSPEVEAYLDGPSPATRPQQSTRPPVASGGDFDVNEIYGDRGARDQRGAGSRAPFADDDPAEDDDDDWDDEEFAAVPIDPSQYLPTFTEKCVRPHTAVCVIGQYDAVHNGLRPRSSSGRLNRLMLGEGPEVVARLTSTFWSYLIGGLVVLAIVHGVIYLGIRLAENEPSRKAARAAAAFKAADEGDLAELQRQAAHGIDFSARDREERTLLHAAKTPEMIDWLLDRGLDVNAVDQQGRTALMLAARDGDVPRTQKLIERHADLNLRQPQYRTTALMQADAHEQPETAALLRAAGAWDDVVTAATGEPLPADSSPQRDACQTYLDAIHGFDKVKAKSVLAADNPATFDFVDWGALQVGRPLKIETFSGYATADRATVRARGQTPGGFAMTWVYQLALEHGAWKIVRERESLRDLRGELRPEFDAGADKR